MTILQFNLYGGSFSFVSLCSSLHLACIIRAEFKRGHANNPLLKVVFFMTISLHVLTLTICFHYIMLILNGNQNTALRTNGTLATTGCFIIEKISSFAFLNSVLWYTDISIMLFLLIRGYSVSWLRTHSSKQYVIVWITSCLFWLIGWIPVVADDKRRRHFCWANDDLGNISSRSLIIYYFPIFATMLLSIIVLMLALFHLRRQHAILDITAFVGCFFIVWFIPNVNVIAILFDYRGDWLRRSHNLALSLSGLLHYLVWMYLSRVTHFPLHSFTIPTGQVIRQRLWHSSLIISTLKSYPLLNGSTNCRTYSSRSSDPTYVI